MSTKSVIFILYTQQNKKCIYCKREMVYLKWDKSLKNKLNKKNYSRELLKFTSNNLRATLEHLKPKSNGGRNEKSNYAATCNECNRTKASCPHEIFKEIVKNEHDLWLFIFNRGIDSKLNKVKGDIKSRIRYIKKNINSKLEVLVDENCS